MAAIRRQWLWRGLRLGLLSGYLALAVGCAGQAVLPPQPEPAEPHALLTFSSAMQLLALDGEPVDTTASIRALRLAPGQHALRFQHVNSGPEGSAEHAGQVADPFVLEVFEGFVYEFEAMT